MTDPEVLGVSAVMRVIGYCDRLDSQILYNDKTPITDGHVDLYEGPHQGNTTLLGRVAVQVKGKSHMNKKIFKKSSATYPVEREVLTFFRDTGGGIYFYVAIHPNSRKEKIFYTVLNPFKVNRILDSLKDGQATKSIPLKELPQSSADIERIVAYAHHTQNQNLQLGFDTALLHHNPRITIQSLDGVDLSRPALLDLTKTDYAVVVHTEGGMSVPVDVDLALTPPNYVPHHREITISCGSIAFNGAQVQQIDDATLRLTLSRALTVSLTITDSSTNLDIQVESEGSLRERIDALTFLISASEGNDISIGEHELTNAPKEIADYDSLVATLSRLTEVSELLDVLTVDSDLVDVASLSDSDFKALRAMHRGLVRDEEVRATNASPGRYDLPLGQYVATLMVVPGSDEDHWRFFDVLDPSNRNRFRMFSAEDEGPLVEVFGTTYEGLEPRELAVTLNLHLNDIADAYARMEDQSTARTLANHKTLHLIAASDDPSTPQRKALLSGARVLNEWLIAEAGAEATHLINRWQIEARLEELTEATRDEIRSLRRNATRAGGDNADLIEACCAILLGDAGDIRSAVANLSPSDLERLKKWPVWTLSEMS